MGYLAESRRDSDKGGEAEETPSLTESDKTRARRRKPDWEVRDKNEDGGASRRPLQRDLVYPHRYTLYLMRVRCAGEISETKERCREYLLEDLRSWRVRTGGGWLVGGGRFLFAKSTSPLSRP